MKLEAFGPEPLGDKGFKSPSLTQTDPTSFHLIIQARGLLISLVIT